MNLRILLCFLIVGLALGATVPTAEADGATSTSGSSEPTTTSDTGSSGSGPDPSTCRPYCFAG